jgi:hypothetical protein
MVKFDVLFEIRAEYLNIIQTSFSFRGLTCQFVFVNMVPELAKPFV